MIMSSELGYSLGTMPESASRGFAWAAVCRGRKIGAGNEIRTRGLNLGKVALYQLSYTRTQLAPYAYRKTIQASCSTDGA